MATRRFHQDMNRVLESRKHFSKNLPVLRRDRKPTILDSDIDGALKVMTMLQHLRSIKAASEESFRIVMAAFLGRGRLRWSNEDGTIVCAADILEELLQQLLEIQAGPQISIDVYNMVLEGYAVCSTPRGDRGYAERAEDLLERIQAMLGDISVTSVVHVVHAFAWQQANLAEGHCAEKASQWLETMLERTSDATILMKCYDWVLEAWSKSGSPGSATKANDVFEKMKQLNSTVASDEVNQIFDTESYSNTILAWAKASEKGAAERCHKLLLEMVQLYELGAFPPGSEPPLIAFNGAIAAWSRFGRSDKSEEILWLMDRLRKSCHSLDPDCISFNSVLHAHLRNPNRQEGLEKAINIVDFMEQNQHEQPLIKPNSFTYSTLLKCWIQSGRPDMTEQAEKMLFRMEKLWEQGDESVRPNNRIFNMVINAYAKSSDRQATKKALALFDRMKNLNICQPDIITITSLMECLSKAADPNAPKHAEALLQEAFSEYKSTNNTKLMPNLRTFTMAILTFAKNNGDVFKARQLLTQLVDLYNETKNPHLKPSEYPYNYVLNCAANTLENKLEAFQIATKTYQEMRKSELVKPDSFTYAFWLKCCNNLLPQNELRQKCIAYAFEECKKDGLVSREVLTRLFQGSSSQLINQLVGLDPKERTDYRVVQLRDLPPAWSRNIAIR